MGVLGKIARGIQDQYKQNKVLKEQEEDFVRTNQGSEAICAFIVALFNKDEPAYKWIKDNKKTLVMQTPLYPVVGEDFVSLCYMQYGDGRSWESSKNRDIEIGRYSFQEMYVWYGLAAGAGYSRLDSTTKKNKLRSMINNKIRELPHIKESSAGGFVIKTFG